MGRQSTAFPIRFKQSRYIKMQTSEIPTGYSVAEFIKRWGIGRNTFYKELANGNLVTIKIGRRRLVTLRAEREWIKAKEKQGGLR
jgi:hypothetical protein